MSQYQDIEAARAAGHAPWTTKVDQISDFHVTVFEDRYPVTRGHLLFVPNYNTPAVIGDAFESALHHGNLLVERGECSGYNIGFNYGTEAGQTVMYPHVHLIPRRAGDCADPVGGVRSVVFGQANYKSSVYQLPA